MKDILVYCIATGILLFYAVSANAVELENASNQQLLRELSFRLNHGGGGGGEETATIAAYCVDGDDIVISVASATNNDEFTLDMLNSTECGEAIDMIRPKLGEFYGTRRFAFCASGDDLVQVTVRSSGGTIAHTSRDVLNRTECLAAAQAINGSR